MIKYGLPYKGSKNSIAKQIIDVLPEADTLYDIFCGGCAITHCAMVNGKYNNYVINDIDGRMPQLFIDAINGKYEKENRWISRDDFYRLKADDAYIASCWSFGNSGNQYLYARKKEPWKRAYHYAVMYGDITEFAKFGIIVPSTDRLEIRKYITVHHQECKEKYIKWYIDNVMHVEADLITYQANLIQTVEKQKTELREYLLTALKRSGLTRAEVQRRLGNQMARHYFGKSQWAFPTEDMYKKCKRLCI